MVLDRIGLYHKNLQIRPLCSPLFSIIFSIVEAKMLVYRIPKVEIVDNMRGTLPKLAARFFIRCHNTKDRTKKHKICMALEVHYAAHIIG